MRSLLSSITILISLLDLSSLAANEISIEIDLYSGLPNPVYVLTDTQSVRLISERVLKYEDVQVTHGVGCPAPLTGLGYRGVRVTRKGISDTATAALSNGAIMLYRGSLVASGTPVGPYCDYYRELERMVLRACAREGLMSQGVHNAIPDSLFQPVRFDGLVTVQLLSNNTFLDFSLLRTYQSITLQNPYLDADLQIGPMVAQGYELNAGLTGIVDAGVVANIPELRSDVTPDSQITLYRSRLMDAQVAVPTSGYRRLDTLPTTNGTQPQLFFLRTSEGGHVAFVKVGEYVGGINRLHFYFSYASDGIFPWTQTGSKRVTPQRGNSTHSVIGAVGGIQSVFDLCGRRVVNPVKSLSSGMRVYVIDNKAGPVRKHVARP